MYAVSGPWLFLLIQTSTLLAAPIAHKRSSGPLADDQDGVSFGVEDELVLAIGLDLPGGV